MHACDIDHILDRVEEESEFARNQSVGIWCRTRDMSLTLALLLTAIFLPPICSGREPAIINDPETMMDGDTTFYNIGNDICILSSMPMKIAILCGHNNSNPINPIPAATWMLTNSKISLSNPAISFSDSPLRLGTNDQLLIDNDGDPIQFADDLRGNYTCILANSEGMDTATTIIEVIPIINTGNGKFDSDPPEGKVFIGNTTCQTRMGDPSAQIIQIRCDAIEAFTFDRTWLFNGVKLTETGTLLNNRGPGKYTCIISNQCGTFNASTSILGPPSVLSSPDPPVDGPGVVFDIGQTVCIDQSISGNVQIRCPLPMNADPEFTSFQWSKVGDPSFSFSGTVLSLPRSDSNSAGDYTCTILSGPRGECGVINATSTIKIKSTITRSSGFIPGIPSGNILTVGADTCLPPPGHSLRIRCQTTPTVPVMWTLNSNPVTGDEFVDVNSAGTYTCSGTDNCGRSLSASSEIIVVNSVSITATIDGLSNNGCSRFPNAPPSATVCSRLRETVRIQCTSSTGNYVISRGSTVFPANQPVVLMPFANSLASTYKCTGDGNMCGTPEDELQVFAGGEPPRIPPKRTPSKPPVSTNITVGEDVCLPFGQSVDIDCVAISGTPPIDYSWTREPSSTVISKNSTLTVSQTGTYICTANNSFGSDNASTNVFEALTLSFSVSASSVPSRCDELKTPPQNTNLCFFTGDSVTLSCLTEGSMTDGTIQPGNDMGTKIIRELSTTDEVFTCGASNVCGNVSSNLTLYIQEPARINTMILLPPPSSDNEMNIGAGRPDRPVEVMENVTVRLYCPFTGFDTPSTRWFRISEDGSRSPVVAMPPNILLVNEILNNISTLVLVINKFQRELEGTYECDTENNAGDDDGRVILRFEEPEPGEWSTTSWSRCNPDCHRGTRMRVVTCRGVNSRLLLPENRCTEEKPASTERCTNRGPCLLDPVWVPQGWSACSQECGGGYRVRNLICQIPRTKEIVSNSRCEGLPRPSTFEQCNLQSCCTGDLYPLFCKLIRGTSLCNKTQYKTACCWSCH